MTFSYGISSFLVALPRSTYICDTDMPFWTLIIQLIGVALDITLIDSFSAMLEIFDSISPAGLQDAPFLVGALSYVSVLT